MRIFKDNFKHEYEFLLKKVMYNRFTLIIFGVFTITSMVINEVRFLFRESTVDWIFFSIILFLTIARGIEILIFFAFKKNYLSIFFFDLAAYTFLILSAVLFESSEHSTCDADIQNFDDFQVFSQVKGYGFKFQLNLVNSILQCARFILVFVCNDFFALFSKFINKKSNTFTEKKYKQNPKKDFSKNNIDSDKHLNENKVALSQLLGLRFVIVIVLSMLLYPLLSSSVWIQLNSSAFLSIKNLSQLSILRNQYPGDESWPIAYMLEFCNFVYTNSIGDSSKWMKLVAIQSPYTLNNNPTCNGCPKSNLEIMTDAMSIISNSEIPSWFVGILTLPTLKEGISLIPIEDYRKIRKQSLRQYVSQVCMRSGIDAISNFYSSCPEELKAKITMVFDTSAMLQLGAGLSIGISFLTLILTVILMGLVHCALEKHIFSSIKRINDTLISIANNPLLALKMSNNAYNEVSNENTTMGKFSNKMLEETFSKLGTLLAVGLGSAGANIIMHNLKDDKVVVKLPGRKIMGIYGFCDIRNFTDATEILGEDVMVFVNQVAEITHGVVCKYGGSANKNVGDAFLFVWKPDQKWVGMESLLADMSIMSFVIIIKQISNCPKLRRIAMRSEIQERIPNYRVKLGFGLHYGWAIEGAIGSEYKIDASYLSPNVNLSSRLESATKHYGVNILFSHDLFKKLSVTMKQFCRKIDCVTLKGSNQPIELYTIDIDPEVQDDETNGIFRQVDTSKLNYRVFSEFFIDNAIKSMRKYLFQDFYYKFNKGLKHYLTGNWQTSKQILLELQCDCIENWGKKDGPSSTLLKFMEEYNYICPINWKGYRVWDEK
ncbi:membrane associated adenylyl cyclase with 6 transmembrane regions and an adenylyl cyclase domain [Cryptosporidium sp. chipmunk genotype I]|uniref:membrane associated adenylyl cyclase with 6 transmembrane regions and an adenylyl cyclase domain n=1 Tax=Cryptosporidium sp. chipmunk genotype I TaxID=1280935 RepID=UPI00351A39BE|nr:membrane associated adenylyl cyclase with 6 transmembrane regions and an adenylyl cyclase domain [Cryptosporidium sp. chipmunk genotype I]